MKGKSSEGQNVSETCMPNSETFENEVCFFITSKCRCSIWFIFKKICFSLMHFVNRRSCKTSRGLQKMKLVFMNLKVAVQVSQRVLSKSSYLWMTAVFVIRNHHLYIIVFRPWPTRGNTLKLILQKSTNRKDYTSPNCMAASANCACFMPM